MTRTDIVKGNIYGSKPMFFNEPKVRHRIIQCLPTISIRAHPINDYRYAAKGNYYTKENLGIIVSTKTIQEFHGLDDNILKQYLSESGFSYIDEWKDAVKRQHRIEKKTDINPNEILYVIRISPICKRPTNL